MLSSSKEKNLQSLGSISKIKNNTKLNLSNLLGKKHQIKPQPILRENKFKKSLNLNNSKNPLDSKFKEKSLNKTLSLNYDSTAKKTLNKSISFPKVFTKVKNFKNNSTKLNLSSLQKINPGNKKKILSTGIIKQNLKNLIGKNIDLKVKEKENKTTPKKKIEENILNLKSSKISNKSKSDTKSKISANSKSKSKKNFLNSEKNKTEKKSIKSELNEFNNIENYNVFNLNQFSSKSKNFEEENYIFSNSKKNISIFNTEEKGKFKSDSKKFFSTNNKSAMKINNLEEENFNHKYSNKKLNKSENTEKKSKTKSFVNENLDIENSVILKSDKKSFKSNSIQASVKKLNFENNLNISNSKNLKTKNNESSSKKKNIENSRSRSITKSKEKAKKLKNELITNKKTISKTFNNLNTIKNKKYDGIKSKVILFLQNQKETKTKLKFSQPQKDLNDTSKTPNRENRINNLIRNSEYKNKNKNLSQNNNINKVKKFKSVSSIKKLYSENPSLKKKVENKFFEKTLKNIKNTNETNISLKIHLKNKFKKFSSEKKKINLNLTENASYLIDTIKSIKSESKKDNFLGKRQGYLDNEENEEFQNPLEEINSIHHLPCFSEGYLFNKLILENNQTENDINLRIKINSEQILKSSEGADKNENNFDIKNKILYIEKNISEQNNVNNLKTIVSPIKIYTNKLTTAIKTSIKKNIPLDSELKLLSKEFRYLLSGKHKEAKETQELLQKKTTIKNENQSNFIEKKLDFYAEEEKILKVENECENSYDDFNDEDILVLENDILQKVLEENFGFKTFLPGQLETIKNILNFKNTLTILPPGHGKSLCYQLPSLVFEGLIIVICPLLASITEQLTNLPGCLSGASLTSFTNQKQRNEIFSAINNKKIKILFITPERLALENLSEIEEISLICFDDANSCSPLSQNFRSSYISIISLLRKIKPNSILLLGNNITNIIENSLIDLFQLDRNNIIKEKLIFPNNFKISISKEENKLTGLVKLLRLSNIKNSGSLLIFCNLRKSVDKVTSFLNQNGLSASAYHAGKSEIERQLIQTNFLNDKIKILVSTSGYCNGISKNDIRVVIIFDMPPSTDLFLQQFSRGGRDKKETFIHIFLNDEDYFIQRNMIYLENIDKNDINKFTENLFSKCYSTNINIRNNSSNQNNMIFNVINDSLPVANEEENQKTRKNFDLPKRISINFTKIQDSTGIKKNMQIFLLLSLINNKNLNSSECIELLDGKLKANYLGIGPTDINLRFFKTEPNELAENEPNLKLILESSKEITEGVFKFSTGEVCEKLGITHVDLINYLYYLQNKGEIGYETKDEGMFLYIEKIPEHRKDIENFLFSTNKFLVNLNIKKVNLFFNEYFILSLMHHILY